MTIQRMQEAFDGQAVEVVAVGSERYVSGPQIGMALGFSDPVRAISKLFSRSQGEFDDGMTLVIEMPTAGGRQLVRLYNARGAALIAMKAQTPKGEAFRRWVLDVLEGKADVGSEASPAAEATGLSPTVLNYLRELFLGKKGNMQMVRLRAAGLRAFEIAKVQDVSSGFIGKKLRVAEELGLLLAEPGTLERRSKAPAFLKYVEHKQANSAKQNAKRDAKKALPAPDVAPAASDGAEVTHG